MDWSERLVGRPRPEPHTWAEACWLDDLEEARWQQPAVQRSGERRPSARRKESVDGALSEQTEVYRYFDDGGRLLYVGISICAVARLFQHTAKSHWIRHVARVEIKRFPTRMAAVRAEWAAIRDERPLYNKLGRPR